MNLTAGKDRKGRFFMNKKTAFTGVFLLLFTLVAINSLTAQMEAVSPPAGFVGVWHNEITNIELRQLDDRTFFILEIGENGRILFRVQIFYKGEDVTSILGFAGGSTFTVTSVNSTSEIGFVIDDLPGKTYSAEIVGQSLIWKAADTRTIYSKGRPRL
jgi:hypothetical protein